MNLEQRLWGICQLISERRKEDDNYDIIWQVGLAEDICPIGEPEHDQQVAAEIQVGSDYTIIMVWWNSGPKLGRIEVQVASTWAPGDITDMTIVAAGHPIGDFQIADAMDAIL